MINYQCDGFGVSQNIRVILSGPGGGGRNMSCHALMGCPDARVETMALVILLYVLVYIVGKMR